MEIQVKYVTMIVKDIVESIKFYMEAMGFEIDSQSNLQPGNVITLMTGKRDAMLELIQV